MNVAKTSKLSIHAPTRGATLHLQNPVISDSLSIHAPTRGATKEIVLKIPNHSFQSTLLQEERPLHLQNPFISYSLSIHAPTRGATISHSFPISKFASFNPRSYKRSDEGSDKVNLLTQIFQSTLLQEERLLQASFQ